MKLFVDEAWRWPLAWPMYIGIILPIKKFTKNIFEDSKKLTEKQREELYAQIENIWKNGKIKYSIWNVTAAEIDKHWVTKALNLAIRRWMYNIFFTKNKKIKAITKNDIKNLQKEYWEDIELIIDWNNKFWLDKDLGIIVETVIKWDSKIKEISMASIVAKVSRDRIMENEMDKKYPKYNFKKHKWYGTKEHRDAIKRYWPCEIHRKLFLRKMTKNKIEL